MRVIFNRSFVCNLKNLKSYIQFIEIFFDIFKRIYAVGLRNHLQIPVILFVKEQIYEIHIFKHPAVLRL